jgi:putative intracellular protease/amidase
MRVLEPIVESPAGSGDVEAVADQVAAGSFDDPGACRWRREDEPVPVSLRRGSRGESGGEQYHVPALVAVGVLLAVDMQLEFSVIDGVKGSAVVAEERHASPDRVLLRRVRRSAPDLHRRGPGCLDRHPQARPPTVDPLSLDLRFNKDQADVDSQKAYLGSLKPQLDKPLVLGEVNPAGYDVMFVVGGHGPMQDLAVDPDIGGLIGAFLGDPAKILAAVCHGPASFLSAHDASGNWLFKGRRLTAFSNEEENQSGFAGNAPWLLEDRLRLAGPCIRPRPSGLPPR